MKVLAFNAGSISIKYQLFDMTDQSVLVAGILEGIGRTDSRLKHLRRDSKGDFKEHIREEPVANHQDGFRIIKNFLSDPDKGCDLSDLFGIGHRVVHGGEAFQEPALINDEVISDIKAMIPLAPLHNPASLIGVEVACDLYPDVPQIAIFDTAFHQTMPPHAFHYAVPHDFYERYQVRRYGFHGISYQYVVKQAAANLNKPLKELNVITLHLGNGASAAAIQAGRSIDTSMGMTPLEGLVMGTRCGDLDPAIPGYLARQMGKTSDEIDALLEHQSGLKGLCGTSDMRELARRAESGDPLASLALEMFCYRVRKYIGAYFAVLGQVDVIVFTGGIGENSQAVRRGCLQGLSCLGVEMDEGRNQAPINGPTEIQSDRSRVKVLVIPTNEELQIAIETVECIQGETCEKS